MLQINVPTKVIGDLPFGSCFLHKDKYYCIHQLTGSKSILCWCFNDSTIVTFELEMLVTPKILKLTEVSDHGTS